MDNRKMGFIVGMILCVLYGMLIGMTNLPVAATLLMSAGGGFVIMVVTMCLFELLEK